MRQVSFTLLMNVVIIVIQLSTRGTVDADNWFLWLSVNGGLFRQRVPRPAGYYKLSK